MRLFGFSDALAAACAILVLLLGLSATPDPVHADPVSAQAEFLMIDSLADAASKHMKGGSETTPSCHPDLTCSPSAVLAIGPLLSEPGVQPGERRQLNPLDLSSFTTPVDLPPPRTGPELQS